MGKLVSSVDLVTAPFMHPISDLTNKFDVKSFEFLCKVTKNLANYPIPLTYFNMLMRSWFQEDSHEQLKKIIGKAFSEKMRTFNSFIELLGKPEPKYVTRSLKLTLSTL